MTLELIDNAVPWPCGARCAVAITFDIDTDSILHLDFPDNAENMLSAEWEPPKLPPPSNCGGIK